MVTTMSSPAHRSSAERHGHQHSDDRSQQLAVNVNEPERLISVLGGAALGLFGLSRGSLAGLGLAAVGGALVYRGMTGHCNVYQALGIHSEHTSAPIPGYRGFKVEESIVVNRPAAELYHFWRNFENLPQIMSHLESVTVNGNRSHWVAKGPLGISAEWDAEIHNERPNEMVAWQSLPGSTVATAGSVHFNHQGEGRTEVRVSLKYDPPGGTLGQWFAWLTGEEPSRMIREDLQRFKARMESGQTHSTQRQATHA